MLTGVPEMLAAIVGALIAWLATLHLHRRAMRETQKQLQAEKEARTAAEDLLTQARRRRESPWYQLTTARPFLLYLPSPQLLIISLTGPKKSGEIVLRPGFEEVHPNTPPDNPVLLLVTNIGAEPMAISKVELDGQPIALEREPQVRGAKDYQWFRYPWRPALRGQEQELLVHFVALDGFEDTHRYLTRHGRRFLARTDPPTSQPGA